MKESRKSASDRRGNLDESWETTGSEQNEKKNVNSRDHNVKVKIRERDEVETGKQFESP